MINMNALNAQQVYITTRLDTDTSFGVRVDNGEQVFINAKLVRDKDLDAGDTRKLILTPNPSGKSDTPWQAIGVSIEDTVPEKPTPRVEEAKLEDRIMAYFDVADNEHAITAPALAENMGVEDLQMQMTLTRMHNAGEMAKAQVHCKGGQEKASWVLWAPSADWFAW
jgi:hypothetical protein